MADFYFDIPRGDGRTITVTATYPDWHELAGQEYSLTGRTVWFSAKHSLSDPDERAVIAKKTGGEGITISGNTAVITIDGADTELLTRETTLKCDIQVFDPDALTGPWTVAVGDLVITPDVTRETS